MMLSTVWVWYWAAVFLVQWKFAFVLSLLLVGDLILFPLSTAESVLLWMWTWTTEGWKTMWDKDEWWERLLWEWL